MVAFIRTNSWAWAAMLAAAVWFALAATAPAQDRQPPVNADLSASIERGFGRLIFTFPEEMKTDVQLANNILVIKFARPVKIQTDALQATFKELMSIVRADPDGTAIRIALSQKISVNSMAAGEKLFVDLLPANWVGMPPGLPQEVVDDLARRARDAERLARNQPVAPAKVWQPIRLRVAEAPTFIRYAFEIAEPMTTAAEQDGQELRITFAAPAKIDFGDAKARMSQSVVTLDADYADGIAVMRMVLAPGVAVRHFREESAFIVDVTPAPQAPPVQVQGNAGERRVPQTPQQTTAPMPLFADNEMKAAPETVPAAPAHNAAKTQTPPAPAAETMPVPPARAEAAPETGTVKASVTSSNAGIRVEFPFKQPVASAIFRRGEWVWIVFDTARAIDIEELVDDKTRVFSDITIAEFPDARAVRLRLNRKWLVSAGTDGQTWTVHFGDAVVSPSEPLNPRRVSEDSGAVMAIPLAAAAKGKVHKLEDASIGDDIHIVTAFGPPRGVLRLQDFVEFRLLPSAQGIALVPLADDLAVTLKPEIVVIARPAGLAVSELGRTPSVRRTPANVSALDATTWESERNRQFKERESEILTTVSLAPAPQRLDARIALATFYLSHRLAAEAKGTLEAAVREDSKLVANARFHLLRGVAELMIGRPDAALSDLSNTDLKDSHDAALMRAVAQAELSNWSEAREQFRAGLPGLKLLPVELQRLVYFAALRAAVEVRDFNEAARLIHEIETVEVPPEHEPEFTVLQGRLAEGLGRIDRAEKFYNAAAEGPISAAAAEARFKKVEVRIARGELTRPAAIEQLESLSFGWRGDRIELESNRLLARLYVGEARYREAFRLLDAALLTQKNAPVTRTFHNEMASVFEDLFLSGKADALPPIEALALYYDFSKLTPVGRRGDELIRRLSDRLVAVDLLDQAAELLQHQVQFRLTGAAKSQVATRLAIVHLLNRNPQKAIGVLAGTRQAELPQDLREQRLLLESRALMDSNRFDQALDVITSLQTPEADRQRADVLWAAKRWRQAGEAIEAMLGERWKEEGSLDEVERHDVLRAGLAYALANETLALTRLREKFAARLASGAEREALDEIAKGANPSAIGAAAKALSHIDSLAVFLKLYHARYPAGPIARNEQLSAR